MTKARTITFGCRLNTYESEVARAHADAAGLSDAIIVNTCAVTSEAVRQARQRIRRERRENPDARIIVTGCAAQIDPDMFATMDDVDHVIGNDEKMQAGTFSRLFEPGGERVVVNDIMSVTETANHLIGGLADRARAFVQVQNGCDHRCTFCIIPYGRGNSRSVPAGVVVEQVKELVGRGYNEVVLTGVDLTSYGPDLPGSMSLGTLVQAILEKVPDLPRLRISSIDSIEVDEPLIDAIAGDRRLMPHLHLSLQAGDNMILKRMKRRHLRDDSIAFCAAMRKARPDIVFGADLIAGFPTETDEMFENTLALVAECGLTYLHVFPYSARPGTPAALMPQVNGQAVRERATLLRRAGDRSLHDFLSGQIGQRHAVLVERAIDTDQVRGRTEQFAEVVVKGQFAPSELVNVEITGQDGSRLDGRVRHEVLA